MNSERYNRGLEKARQKDYSGAIAEFTGSLQEDPYSADTYVQRGLAYYDSGAIHTSVSDYTEAIKLNPQSVEAYYCRALARLALKNLPGALSDVDKTISLNSKHAAAYNLRGIVRRKQGSIPDAIASFKKAAELFLEQKDKDNCRLCLEKIKELQPKPQPVPVVQPTIKNTPIISEAKYFTRLLDLAEKGDTRQALDDLNWVLQADPNDGRAYCCRGVVRCKMGNYRDAISDFNQALRLQFQDSVVYRNRARARSQLGDYQGALADFNQALQIQPQDALLYVARGNTHRSMSNYFGAIKDYSKALEINPDDAQAYYNRGLANAHIEEMHSAVQDYQKAASIFCEKEDWDNYQKVLDSLKKIQSPSPDTRKATNNILRQRLLRLVGGYWEIAQRLIDQAQFYYPGRSEEWYMEKVITDLEKDRGW